MLSHEDVFDYFSSQLLEAFNDYNVNWFVKVYKLGKKNFFYFPPDEYVRDGYSLIHLACQQGKDDLVKALLQFKFIDVTSTTNIGLTALHIAAVMKNYKCLELLLEAKADVDAKISKNMIKKYSNNWCNDFGSEISLLCYAFTKSDFILMKILIKYGADITVKDSLNRTLLMLCIRDQEYKFIEKYLLHKLNVDHINVADNNNLTVCHHLINNGDQIYNVIILQKLLDAGLNVNSETTDDPAYLPLNYASTKNNSLIVKKILDLDLSQRISSRPLFYALGGDLKTEKWPSMDQKLSNSAIIILHDIYLKISLNFPVHSDEMGLFNKFLTLRRWSKTKKYLDGQVMTISNELKGIIICEVQQISLYDILVQSRKERNKFIRETVFKNKFKEIMKQERRSKIIPTLLKIQKLIRREELILNLREIYKQSDCLQSFFLIFDLLKCLKDYLDTSTLESLSKI